MAEILSIKNRLNPLIQLTKPPNFLSGFIGGIIVDKKNFVLILRKLLLKAEPESIGQGNYIFLFVITGNNNTNGFFQKKPLSKMPTLHRGHLLNFHIYSHLNGSSFLHIIEGIRNFVHAVIALCKENAWMEAGFLYLLQYPFQMLSAPLGKGKA